MDGNQFDVLTRSIAKRLSRRLTFKALTAGLAAGALSQAEVEPADAARCRPPGKSCKRQRGKPRPKCCAGSVCRGNRCQCKGGRQQCGNKCITRRQCCRNSECANNQICRNNRCRCRNGRKLCQGACIANSQCCAADCATGTCTCTQAGRPVAPGANECQQPEFEQDFTENLDGWYAYDARTSDYLPPQIGGTMTLKNNEAVIKPGIFDPDEDLTAMSTLGGYSNVWPEGGFTTELDIYLDTEFPDPGTHFSYDVGVRSTSCSLQNEFMMNGGTGSGENAGKYCVSGADGGAATNPCTYDDHYEVTTSGWYRFRHEFRNNGGTLQVTMKLLDTNNKELASWVAENDADTIGPGGDVGGNAFQWFPRQHFPDGLRIRNSRRTTHF